MELIRGVGGETGQEQMTEEEGAGRQDADGRDGGRGEKKEERKEAGGIKKRGVGR